MSTVANLSDVAAEAQANTLATLCNGGTINIYSGPQPANANTALSGNTLLVTLGLGSPAFGSAAPGGILTANAISSGTAVGSGTATFGRIVKSDGVTVVMDVQVGISGAGINLPNPAIIIGGLVAVSGFTYTVTET